MSEPPHQSGPSQPRPKPMPRPVLCPYCGTTSHDTAKCSGCGGLFDPLSRQATQNAMGPWFIRDQTNPFRPGCSFETLRGLIARGKVGPDTVIRGPSTRQFWELSRRAPGIANLLGLCHNCQAAVDPAEFACRACGVAFNAERDRQHLGVGSIRLLPGQASPERIAAASLPAHAVSPDRAASTSAPAAAHPEPIPTGPSRSRSPKSMVFLVALGTIALGASGVAVWRLGSSGALTVVAVDETPVANPTDFPPPTPKTEPRAMVAVDESVPGPAHPKPGARPQTKAPQALAADPSVPAPPSAVWRDLDRLRTLR